MAGTGADGAHPAALDTARLGTGATGGTVTPPPRGGTDRTARPQPGPGTNGRATPPPRPGPDRTARPGTNGTATPPPGPGADADGPGARTAGQQTPPPDETRPIWEPRSPGPDDPGPDDAWPDDAWPDDAWPDDDWLDGTEPDEVAAGPPGPSISGPYPADPGVPEPGPGAGDRAAQRLRLADLVADSRMRIWKRRVLFAVAAGVVFTFVFTWRAGLTAAVLAAIADTVYRSRTTASIPPGVRLTGAQKRTQRQLAHMEGAGYRALHSRPIPDSREFIDHFVVGPTGAYAIDSEAWDKRLPVRTRNARQLFHGPFSKKERLEHARWEARQASERISAELGTEVYVRPALAVYGPKIPWTVATIRDVDVFSGGRLRKYLRRNAAMKGRPKLAEADIARIHAAAAQLLPLGSASSRAPVG